jgi:recombinational DNA repair protein (RecF pathway)
MINVSLRKCNQCRGKYSLSDFYKYNGREVCRECLIFNLESLATKSSLNIADYLKRKR